VISGEPSHAEVASAVTGLDVASITTARWFGGKGRAIARVEAAEAFVLPGGAGSVLAIARIHYDRGAPDRYVVPLARDGSDGTLRVAEAGDGVWRALAVAVAEGRTIPALVPAAEDAGPPGPVSAALVCRPARALGAFAPLGVEAVRSAGERALGADQSNTSVVLGERLLLKAYRCLQAGLNPELELVAYLSEEAGFPAIAPLAGYVELVSATDGVATVALLQEYIPNAVDAYEWLAETLTGWLLAPGVVSVEYATEFAADMGTLTAALHATLAAARGHPDLEPREATRDELREWHEEARRQLDVALEVTPDESGRLLRTLAPAIAEELTVFEALPSVPLLTRIHGDLHLGQVLVAEDGYRIVDLEGEPTRPLEARRAHRSPLRDVASMLRSLDHVGRSAGRRAVARHGGPLEAPGLDLDGWLTRARGRFIEAYRSGLREAGAPITVDPALLRAFEIEKECYEFVYAATWLPEWRWAPTEGMRALMAGAGEGA
jgi:maltose alpha-D-glucosyltransferase/alpha-amylase